MAINTIFISDEGAMGRIVDINPNENIQCSRVTAGTQDEANQLWFFEPTDDFANDALIGVQMVNTGMKSEPVILSFNTSAAILPIVQDLMIIYGNLTRAGL